MKKIEPISQQVMETVLYAEDLEAVRPFYEQVLGLELMSSEPGRHLFFRIGAAMLLVFQPDQTQSAVVTVGGNRIPAHGQKGAGHVAFQVDAGCQRELLARLEAAGIPVETTIDWPAERGQSIYCRDPAGNSIEFAPPTLWR